MINPIFQSSVLYDFFLFICVVQSRGRDENDDGLFYNYKKERVRMGAIKKKKDGKKRRGWLS